jgi:hypothetical protein
MGAGCVEVEVAPPLVIRGAARASVENGQCSWSIEQPSPLRAEGVLDLAFKTSYFFSPLFEGTVEFAHERQSLLPDPDFMIERYLVEAREGTADGPLLRGPDVVNPLTVHRSVQIEAPPSGGRGRGVDVFVALTDPMGAALYESLCVGRGAIVQPPGRDARCPVPQFRPELTARVVLRVRAFGQQRDVSPRCPRRPRGIAWRSRGRTSPSTALSARRGCRRSANPTGSARRAACRADREAFRGVICAEVWDGDQAGKGAFDGVPRSARFAGAPMRSAFWGASTTGGLGGVLLRRVVVIVVLVALFGARGAGAARRHRHAHLVGPVRHYSTTARRAARRYTPRPDGERPPGAGGCCGGA